VLLAFFAVSLWVLGLDLWRVLVEGRVWTGTDGLFLTDQMQYVAWIQSASRQLLISDLFVVHGSPASYLQPLVAISAVFTRVGVAAWLSLLLWQPVAVAAMFIAVRAFARAALPGSGQRHAALVIGLFGGGLPAIGDLWPGFWSWGYPFPLIGIAALPAALVMYGRARERTDAAIWAAAALGALCSWCHPWQGETLLLVVLGTEVVLWHLDRRRAPTRRVLTLASVTVLGTALPLLYLLALSKLDVQWSLARIASRHTLFPATVLESFAPLLIAAAFAYRRRPVGFIAVATRLWVPAAVVVFFVSQTGISAVPLHAFAGLTVPLAVLSVEGAMSCAGDLLRRSRWLALLLIALVTVPTTIDELKSATPYVKPSPGNANFIADHDHDALTYLAANRKPGAVFTRGYLGLITPALTGRHVYEGSCEWSEPNCAAREGLLHNVFVTPGYPDSATRASVLSSDARFVLNSTCTLPGKDLDTALAPIAVGVKRFGCATVYEIRDRPH
jgi:hypothetical protein